MQKIILMTILAEPYSAISVPKFRYGDFDVPSFVFAPSDAGVDYAGGMAVPSWPLQWKVALYHVGRDIAWGVGEADELADAVKEAGRMTYARAHALKGDGGERTLHRDAVRLYPKNNAPKGWARPQGDYRFGVFLKGLRGFVRKGDKWEVIDSSGTEKIYVSVPSEGFIVPTCDGAYHPQTGMPFATEPSGEKARDQWIKRGATFTRAGRELSRLFRINEGRAVVESLSTRSGPLSVSLREMDGVDSYRQKALKKPDPEF